jgi:hypothetical protein
MFKNLIFFQNGRGQKRFGIEKTVQKLYNHYKYKYEFMNISTHFIKDTKCLKTNLANLYSLQNFK